MCVSFCGSTAGFPEAAPSMLIRRLAYGGVQVGLLLEADAAKDAIRQQAFLKALKAPSHVASAAAQPDTCGLALRYWFAQMSVRSAGASLQSHIVRLKPKKTQNVTLQDAHWPVWGTARSDLHHRQR